MMQRITPDYLASQIKSELYLTPVGTLTICVLTMANGLHIVGKSACLNPADFNAERGRQYAKEDAVKQLWALEGYARASAAAGNTPTLKIANTAAELFSGLSDGGSLATRISALLARRPDMFKGSEGGVIGGPVKRPDVLSTFEKNAERLLREGEFDKYHIKGPLITGGSGKE